MDRRQFLKTSLAGAAGLLGGIGCIGKSRNHANDVRLNIILIIDDQHNSKAMGWTGMGDGVKTPSLDKLASQSVAFTNAYSTCPVCAPARHSLYTGLYASQHGVVHNDIALRDDIPTVMKMLSQAGYTTANIGKMHFGPYNARHGFQYVINHEFYQDGAGISHFRPYLEKEVRKRGLRAKRFPVWNHVEPPDSWQFNPEGLAFQYDLPKDLTGEHFVTDQSIEFIKDQIQNRPKKPFFLHASYFAPHHPYGPVKEFDTYDPEDMVLPPSWTEEKAKRFGAEIRARYGLEAFTEEDYKKLKASYLGYITQVDYEIGRLLDWLDSNPEIADNTIVVFMSDHGDMMGEHGRLFKDNMYEGSAAVPLMIRWPGITPKKEQTVVSGIDIVPTLLAAAGIDSQSELPGRDLKSLMTSPNTNPSWENRTVFSEWFLPYPWGAMTARQGRWKLIANRKNANESVDKDRCPEFSYQLFDLENDPWEMKNLAGNPEYQLEYTRLKKEIHEHCKQYSSHLPRQMPSVVPRSKWDIHWPTDPWKQTEAKM